MHLIDLDSNEILRDRPITSTTHDSEADYNWQAFNYSDIPVFNNGLDLPQYYDTTDNTLKTLPNFPESRRPTFLTPFFNFMVALEGQDVYWGDAFTTVGTISTSWDFTTTVREAGLNDLSGLSDGEGVALLELNGSLIIYMDHDVIRMSPSGSTSIFNFKNIFNDNGALSKKSVARIPNGHFVVGNSQIYIHDGITKQQIGEDTWRREFFSDLNVERLDEFQVIYDQATSSVWMIVPTETNDKIIYIYNLQNNTITVLDDHRDIGYTIFAENGIPGNPVTIDTIPFNSIDEIPLSTIDEFREIDLGQYAQKLISINNNVSAVNTLFIHDFGTTYNGRTINSILRRDNMTGGNDEYSRKYISRIIPHIYGEGDITISVGGSNSVNSTVVFKARNRKAFDIENKVKVDIRETVRYPAISFENATAGTILESFEIDIMEIAGR